MNEETPMTDEEYELVKRMMEFYIPNIFLGDQRLCKWYGGCGETIYKKGDNFCYYHKKRKENLIGHPREYEPRHDYEKPNDFLYQSDWVIGQYSLRGGLDDSERRS